MTEQVKQTVQVKQTELQQTEKKRPLSRPLFTKKLTLNSIQSQRVMARSFSRISNAFFSMDVILQIIGEQESIDQVDEVISGYIEHFETDLDSTLEQLKGLMESNGITETPSYSSPIEYTIEITSPSIAVFSRLMLKFDELMSLVDTVWLNGVLDKKQRSNATYEWQQRLFKLAARIIGVEKRARLAAYNKGKGDEVDQSAPEQSVDDPEIAAEAKAEENEIEEEKTAKK